jgi:hypothetical protein
MELSYYGKPGKTVEGGANVQAGWVEEDVVDFVPVRSDLAGPLNFEVSGAAQETPVQVTPVQETPPRQTRKIATAA